MLSPPGPVAAVPMKTMELLEPELRCPYPPVSTVTFYKQNSISADTREAVLEFLHKRVQEILLANTWLAGEFRREAKGRKGKIQFLVPKKQGVDSKRHVMSADLEGIRPDLDSNTLGKV